MKFSRVLSVLLVGLLFSSLSRAEVASPTLRLSKPGTSPSTLSLLPNVIWSGLPFDFPSVAPFTLSPSQIKAVYGFNQLPSSLQGAGQTIALVDAFGEANIQADLNTFSSYYGLPTTSIRIISSKPYATGDELTTSGKCLTTVSNPGTPVQNCTEENFTDAQGWSSETALDVEWAHAIAPQASLILVVSPDDNVLNLINAVDCAAQSGAKVVSMSFGAPESEVGNLQGLDFHFQVPGVTFVAATGDSGDYGPTEGVNWPAVSSSILAVGGTALSSNNPASIMENAWSHGGGGMSLYNPVPAFQVGWNNSAYRTIPDVAYDAEPDSGYVVFDSNLCSNSPQGSAIVLGGTSAGSPQWGALVALANSQRTQAVAGTAASTIYGAQAPTKSGFSYTNDITSGCDGSGSGECAVSGYDIVTGLGSPKGGALVRYLIGQDLAITNLSLGSSPKLGSPVPVSITVKNQGRFNSPNFQLSLYANLSGAPTTATTPTVSTTVAGLTAGASITVSLSVTYSAVGVYSLWAMADSTGVVVETNESNNVAGPISLRLYPNLVVSGITPSASVAAVGVPFPVSVTISNQGTAPASAFSVGIYQNSATKPALNQTPNASINIASLAAGASTTVTASLTYGAAGAKSLWVYPNYTGIAADGSSNLVGPIAIQAGLPNLVVTQIVPSSSLAAVGVPFAVSLTIVNKGSVAAGAFSVGLYQNQTTPPTLNQAPSSTINVPSLAAGATTTATAHVTFGATGIKTMWAYANYNGVLINGSSNIAGPVTVTAGIPDLVVTKIQPATGPAIVGVPFSVTITVMNKGNVPAGPFSVGVYQNQTTAPTLNQTPNASFSPTSLAVGASFTATVTVTFGAPGTKSMWAYANYNGVAADGIAANNITGPVTVVANP